jgi:membrane protein
MKNKEKIIFVKKFVTKDIWRIQHKDYNQKKSFYIRLLQIILLAYRKFREDNVQLRASALTFYTMLSIVPVVAMGFGIAKGFGFERFLREELIKKLQGQEEVMNWVITFADKMLEHTKGGLIAGVGLGLLFWAIMKVFGNIESSFNAIWQVKKSRGYIRKFSDYLSLMLIAPLMIILSSSITVFITTQVKTITAQISIIGLFSPAIFFLIKLIPYVIIWLLFSFIFIIMPNTKVNWKSGLIAGLISGTIFQVIQWLYIKFQVRVSNYNAIYGSFAALPLFLIWLQLSWLIVLLGAEIAFAKQNVQNFVLKADMLDISITKKKILSLLIARLVIKRFAMGQDPPKTLEIADELHIPIDLVKELSEKLVSSRIFFEVCTIFPDVKAYVPAMDINSITIHLVTFRLENRGDDDIKLPDSIELNKITDYNQLINKSVVSMRENILVKDL